jgi:hypothetical protein
MPRRPSEAVTSKPGSGSTTPTTGDFFTENSDDLLPQLRQAPIYNAADTTKSVQPLESFLDTDYYRGKIVIITFLRRFGCPVCRSVFSQFDPIQ